MSPESGSPLWSALSESAMFRDYQAAFEKATGLPLSLHPPGTDHESGSMDRPAVGNTFCALMARTNRSCEACFALQRKLEQEAKLQPKTLKCFAGLCETAVPVRVGEGLIAFLQTGRILIESPNQRQFSKTTRELLRLGTEIDLKQLEEAYYATRVLAPDQYESMVRLLTIFASHLAAAGNQLALQRSAPDDSPVSRARQIIDEGFCEELSLGEIAQRVNVSAGYFSMLFKKATGLNFVDYVARLRVEKAKNLLQNPKFRISEVAYEVGFQSLSQFNRTFRRILGTSPRAWRATLGGRNLQECASFPPRCGEISPTFLRKWRANHDRTNGSNISAKPVVSDLAVSITDERGERVRHQVKAVLQAFANGRRPWSRDFH